MPVAPADFQILAETSDLIVVDKPPGLLVHPTKPNGKKTMLDGLRELLAFEMENGGQVSIINRLDRETSGLVLIAKHSRAASLCAKAMQAGNIAKEYLALATGWPDEDEFEMNAPLLRQGEVGPTRIYLKRMIHPAGQPALTRFRVETREQTNDGFKFSRIRAWPITGRTHQIRVHLAGAGFPILGDKLYGPDEGCYLRFIETDWTPELAAVLRLNRQALHSTRLQLHYEGTEFDWTSPLPRDLREFGATSIRSDKFG